MNSSEAFWVSAWSLIYPCKKLFKYLKNDSMSEKDLENKENKIRKHFI